jgi:hypothetical protein
MRREGRGRGRRVGPVRKRRMRERAREDQIIGKGGAESERTREKDRKRERDFTAERERKTEREKEVSPLQVRDDAVFLLGQVQEHLVCICVCVCA